MDNPDLDNKYKYLLDTNNPDKHIEYFWYGFKTSITNFFKHYHLPDNLPVEAWSKHLNNLQKDKEYLEIEEEIRSYLEKFGWYVIMYSCNYNAQIFATNIKRWNKISNHYNWNIESEPTVFNIYFNIFLSIIKRERQFKDKPYLYQMLLVLRRYTDCEDDEGDISNIENLYKLLDQALEYKEEATIDQVGKVCDIWSYVNDTYDLNILPGTKGKKILIKYVKSQ